MSKFSTKLPSLTENYSKKYLKRLAGRSDLEDALKKLDERRHEWPSHKIWAIQNVDGRVNDVNDRRRSAHGVYVNSSLLVTKINPDP